MSFKFASQQLLNGLFEPEGIYLFAPFEGELPVIQGWGDSPEFYGQWRYNGVPLKGHVGIDVRILPGARLFAMDAGKVTEIGVDHGGFEHYIKIEHRWGESFYAHTGPALVETGKSLARGDAIATAPQPDPAMPAGPDGRSAKPTQTEVIFHFAIRVQPWNRYDGWGGFTDPLPYLPPDCVFLPEDAGDDARHATPPHPMTDDRPGLRRP
jgi:murein DD-endopeptidase MepM/ murein hydrolase activator NlpD